MTSCSNQESTSFDSMLDALRSRHRRRVLVNLMEKNPRSEATQLQEFSMTEDTHQARMRLYHNDLPKLDDMGFIDWYPESGEIVKGTNFEAIRPLLEMMVNHEDDLPNDLL